MSITSFSQNTLIEENKYGPKIIIDSSGVKLLAFNEKDLSIIMKELKVSGLRKRKIKQLEKKLNLLNKNLSKQKELSDSLKSQYNKCIQISVSKSGVIDAKSIRIKKLKEKISNYKKIDKNNKEIIKELKSIIESNKVKIKRKNRFIVGLTATNILTGILLLLSL